MKNEKYTPLVEEIKDVVEKYGNFLGYEVCENKFGGISKHMDYDFFL